MYRNVKKLQSMKKICHVMGDLLPEYLMIKEKSYIKRSTHNTAYLTS